MYSFHRAPPACVPAPIRDNVQAPSRLAAPTVFPAVHLDVFADVASLQFQASLNIVKRL